MLRSFIVSNRDTVKDRSCEIYRHRGADNRSTSISYPIDWDTAGGLTTAVNGMVHTDRIIRFMFSIIIIDLEYALEFVDKLAKDTVIRSKVSKKSRPYCFKASSTRG